jgi:hypothetical protein
MMMETPVLQTLEGRKVTQAIKVHDYVQIAFGDDVGLSIYNDIILEPDVDISDLLGRQLESTIQTERRINFRFSGGVLLQIDLHPQASHGPEILELNRKGYPSIVWPQM